MLSVNEKYPFTTAEESVREKQWSAGSSIATNYSEFVIKSINNKLVAECITVKYPPALTKIIDEVLVNALDHFIRSLGTTNPVTQISFDFDQTGKVRIFNNGNGVEILIHPAASEKLGVEIWTPTLVFSRLFQGSNRKHEPDSIIGGTNGLGSKLALIYSLDAIVETVDSYKYFAQRWRLNKSIEEMPIIIDLKSPSASKLSKEKKTQHTVLSFTPDYDKTFNVDITKQYETYNDILRTRSLLAAAYVGYTLATLPTKQKFDFTFNGEKLPVTGLKSIAEILFPNTQYFHTIIKPELTNAKTRWMYKYPWEVVVVICNNTYAQKHISIVNGIVVSEGKHITHISNLIVDAVSEKITKLLQDKNLKFNASHVTKNIFLMINCKIPTPSWTGQRKDVLDIDIRKLAGYKLDAKFTNQITDKIKDQILESIFADYKRPKTKGSTVDIGSIKYTKAGWAGGSKSHLASLLLMEGDSAKNQADIGITNSLTRNEYGSMSTGGVIMNARRQVSYIETLSGSHLKKSEKIEKNAFICALIANVGLNDKYTYDPASPTYKKEMASLNYGCIIACVDSDVDGKGNILGLILSLFAMIWPNLINTYLKWFCTPIMRAYPKKRGKVFSFYSILEYERWQAENDESNYNISYYKGLGTNSRDETISMFADIKKHLYTYRLDDRSQELFNIYFGEESNLRKIELAKPSRIISKEIIAEQERTMVISCSDFLEQDVNEYQKDNLDRKLDHVIDGCNQSSRKIASGVLQIMKPNIKQKVEKIAGPISESQNYHHGGASLQKSIQGKAFVTVGGKQTPILVPLSMLGSRICGGDKAAAPRYTDVLLNHRLTKLLFPPEDYHSLEFNFEDNKRFEPKFFIPLIPLAITESSNLPGHGWKLKKWARDVPAVITNIRRMITYGDDAMLFNMPATRYAGSAYQWNGEFKEVRGKPFSFGKYDILDENSVTPIIKITELPLCQWTDPYIEDLTAKAKKDDRIIDSIESFSNDLIVDIRVKLKPNAMNLLNEMGDLCYTDGVEEYFMLREHMDSCINLMGIGGVVHEFTNYEQPMRIWFVARKNQYAVRIERQRKVLELKVIMFENMIRYAEENINMRGLSDQLMEEAVKARNFMRLHSGKLNNPKFTPNNKLEEVILHGPKANYDYLLNMSDRKKSTEAIVKLQDDLAKVKQDIINLDEKASLGRFTGAAMFEEELNEFEKVFIEGQKTFWKFEDAERFRL